MRSHPILTGDYLSNVPRTRTRWCWAHSWSCFWSTGMFPVLRTYNERIDLAHLCFRFLEAVIITIGIVAVLSLLTRSQAFVAASGPDPSAFRASGIACWRYMIGRFC
jgi:hypothetical protein